MIDKAVFYDRIRATLFKGHLTDDQVAGIEALLDACEAFGVTDPRQIAYVLATAYHEVNKTMQPIAEYGHGHNRTYGYKVKYNGKPYNDTEALFYGRGFTQNTWYENYALIDKLFGVDTLHNPDLLLTDILMSAAVSVRFMKEGRYTGRKLDQYFNDKKDDPINARRIINGVDKADLIEDYYKAFKDALT